MSIAQTCTNQADLGHRARLVQRVHMHYAQRSALKNIVGYPLPTIAYLADPIFSSPKVPALHIMWGQVSLSIILLDQMPRPCLCICSIDS